MQWFRNAARSRVKCADVARTRNVSNFFDDVNDAGIDLWPSSDLV